MTTQRGVGVSSEVAAGAGRDRTFGPTVLVGLAGSALAAVAATRPWATAAGDAAGIKVDAVATGSDAAPLAAALALVALAGWGVLLVVRGRVRRVVAVIGALAALGALASVVDAFDGAQNQALDALTGQGRTGDVAVASLTIWYYLAAVGALLAALAFVVAVLRAPRWPAMGSKYDAPSARSQAAVSEEDMWRALDDGRDPTS